jgi:hypothetical protein
LVEILSKRIIFLFFNDRPVPDRWYLELEYLVSVAEKRLASASSLLIITDDYFEEVRKQKIDSHLKVFL